jgi:hypothetical protein
LLLTAVPEESYCLKTQSHALYSNGTYTICYRCGMLMGHSGVAKLGSLLDY